MESAADTRLVATNNVFWTNTNTEMMNSNTNIIQNLKNYSNIICGKYSNNWTENSANMNTNTIIQAQLFEYSNNLNIRGNTVSKY